jgi:hypothetical protein
MFLILFGIFDNNVPSVRDLLTAPQLVVEHRRRPFGRNRRRERRDKTAYTLRAASSRSSPDWG